MKTFLDEAWTLVFEVVGALPGGASGSSWALDLLALANYFIPLDVFTALVGQYCALLLLCTTVRVVKSFVPTIA